MSNQNQCRDLRLARIVLFTAILGTMVAPASAIDYYWGGDSTNPGGSGPWSNTDDTWGTNPAGPFNSNQAEVFASSSPVNIFAGPSGGTVTVDGTINVRWITFSTPGYSITGGTLQRLSVAGWLVDGTEDATINSDINLASGFRVLKQGGNTITLNGWNNRGTTISGGTVIAGADARIGIARIESAGTLVLNSGQSGNLRLADGSPFQMTHIAGGTLASSNASGIDITSLNPSTSGTFNFGTAAYTNPITVSANLASTGARTLNVFDNTAITFSGNLTGSGGSYTKTGAGTAIFSGDNAYTGATNVDSGTLLVNGMHTGGGTYSVAADATLGGTGSIGADVNVTADGTLAPGASIGSLDITGNVSLAGILEIEYDTATIDLLNVGGDFDISNATLDFVELAPLGVPNGTALVFATYGSLTGSEFAQINNQPAYTEIVYNYQGSNSIALLAVPEPEAFVLALLAAVTVGVLLSRRTLHKA